MDLTAPLRLPSGRTASHLKRLDGRKGEDHWTIPMLGVPKSALYIVGDFWPLLKSWIA